MKNKIPSIKIHRRILRSVSGFISLLLIPVLLSPVVVQGAGASGDGPAVTREQIEADWKRQEEVRERGISAFQGIQTPATPESDAAGACDGFKDGKWGFHTGDEQSPWWQVDLGKTESLDRVEVYNRCDVGECNTQIMILLSDDGKTFSRVYRHDGKMFYGYPDKKPLTAAMQGAKARYVRLQIPDRKCFYLDEVEIYPFGGTQNIALEKPALQSSISQWSVAHVKPNSLVPGLMGRVIGRGLKLAADLKEMGVRTDTDESSLRRVADRLAKLPADAPDVVRRDLCLEARWAGRRLAYSNALLDFDDILFIKHSPSRFPHPSDYFYGWWSRPGGGVYVLEGFKSENPRLRCLTSSFPEGSYLRPDLSYDGKKVLFAYCKYYPNVPDIPDKAGKINVPEDAFYHVFEMDVETGEFRRLTRGRYDDFDARYLPSGDIVFLSTRKGAFVQCTKANTAATLTATLPDSYVRCGGDNYRPVPVYTLHVMDTNGGNMRPISAFENFEWTPAVANDGRILYSRWDYIDRPNANFFSLWSTNPDGTNPQLVYGNYTARPQVVYEARPIPGSHKIICTAGAHHSNVGGSLIMLDRNLGTEESVPMTRLTPEVPFPETEAWADTYYSNPYPLSEDYYLVSWSDRRLPPHCRVDSNETNPVNATGLYLYDSFRNLNLFIRDPDISSECPIPVRARKKPQVVPDTIAWDGPQEGLFTLQDVYKGLPGVSEGTVKQLRIVAVPPKTQPFANNPSIGISAEDPGKYVLGTVPVERDGSAYFRAPSGIPVFFQALDGEGVAVQTMRSLTYVQPGRSLSCIGCHESRQAAPVPGKYPMATSRPPSKIKVGPKGSWPLKYDELVQPVLDRSCVSCHKPGSSNEKASRFDLTASQSYQNLMGFGGSNLRNLAIERERSVPGSCTTQKSNLWAMLTAEKRHNEVSLDPESRERLATWMDVYAQRQGHFSPAQEEELRRLRQSLAPLLIE